MQCNKPGHQIQPNGSKFQRYPKKQRNDQAGNDFHIGQGFQSPHPNVTPLTFHVKGQ